MGEITKKEQENITWDIIIGVVLISIGVGSLWGWQYGFIFTGASVIGYQIVIACIRKQQPPRDDQGKGRKDGKTKG